MEPGYTIGIEPHGFVRYIDHLGTDKTIVEAARVSYGQVSQGIEKDKKLLRYLFQNRHTSPFEQPIIRFNIRMPIFVMRQFVRHRTFRLNEYSARYKELPDQFFLPKVWREQDQKNRQGSVATLQSPAWSEENNVIAQAAYNEARISYRMLLERGVSKEMARMVMPTAVYTEIFVSCDLHNLMHFFYLRTDEHAQEEIREVAFAMLMIAEKLFPMTFSLWYEFVPKMMPRAEKDIV